MKLYLDDDSASPLLAKLLSKAGHEVRLPADANLSGADDPVHLTYAIREGRVCLSGNMMTFESCTICSCRPAAIILAS